MEKSFVQRILDNLSSDYTVYKRNMNELQFLSNLIDMIKIVEDGRQLKELDNASAQQLDIVLAETYDHVGEILNEHRNMCYSTEINFHRMCFNFEEEIRTIDEKLLPPMDDKLRSTDCAPASAQNTSQHISNTLVRVVTRGTIYEDLDELKKEARGKRFCSSLILGAAWSASLLLTIIAITFLTRDYANAQVNKAIRNERFTIPVVLLPALTICSSYNYIPSFDDYPTAQYPGFPLFMVSAYIRGNRSVKYPQRRMLYPDTRADGTNSPVERVFVTRNRSSCLRQEFDVKREMRSIHEFTDSQSIASLNRSSACSHCFRIGVKQPELIKKPAADSLSDLKNPPVQVLVKQSKLLQMCYGRTHYFPWLVRIMVEEFIIYSGQLTKRGILDYNGANVSVWKLDWSSGLENKFPITDIPGFVSCVCNIYFFSGFFYPVAKATNISYKYRHTSPLDWKRVGTGPYFSQRTWGSNKSLIIGPNPEMLRRDSYFFDGLRIFGEDSESVGAKTVSPQTSMINLDNKNSIALFGFTRSVVNGHVDYHCTTTVKSEKEWFTAAVYDNFWILLDIQRFEEVRVDRGATMTLAEYVTDIFEYLGMFTGICIYTFLVAPAQQPIRRQGQRNRKLKQELENRINHVSEESSDQVEEK